MFTIKKLKAPESKKILQTPKSILTKVPKKTDPKSAPKKISFSDEVGKPLVEYRDLPPKESKCIPPKESKCKVTKCSVTWNLLRVKNARKPLEGALEMGKIEEKRLEDEQISRAARFGPDDVIEPPHLIDLQSDDSLTLIIPLESTGTKVVPQLPENPSHNTYQQVFENTTSEQICVDNPSTTPSPAIFDLVAQLKQRGLVPTEQPSTSDSFYPMPEQRRPSRFSQAWKQGICRHYTSNPKGCRNGNNCRYEHNDAEREAYHRDRRNRSSRGDHWCPRQQSHTPFRGSGARTRFDRSRSPQKVV